MVDDSRASDERSVDLGDPEKYASVSECQGQRRTQGSDKGDITRQLAKNT